MSYFLHLCDRSLPYCATLEACNWFVAGQHLNASHPRSPDWPNQTVTLFLGNYFLKYFYHLRITLHRGRGPEGRALVVAVVLGERGHVPPPHPFEHA